MQRVRESGNVAQMTKAGGTQTLIAHVTKRCNQRCVFCLEDRTAARLSGDMPQDQVRQELRTSRAQGASQIVFMEGETLLRPDVCTLISMAREEGFTQVWVATNGTPLARPGFLRQLQDAGLTGMELSVHGHSEELVNRISGVPFTWKRQCAALAAIAASPLKVMVNVVVCAENHQHLAAIARNVIERAHPTRMEFKFKFVSLLGSALLQAQQAPRAFTYDQLDLSPVRAELEPRSVVWMWAGIPPCALGEESHRSLEVRDLVLNRAYSALPQSLAQGRAHHDAEPQLARAALRPLSRPAGVPGHSGTLPACRRHTRTLFHGPGPRESCCPRARRGRARPGRGAPTGGSARIAGASHQAAQGDPSRGIEIQAPGIGPNVCRRGQGAVPGGRFRLHEPLRTELPDVGGLSTPVAPGRCKCSLQLFSRHCEPRMTTRSMSKAPDVRFEASARKVGPAARVVRPPDPEGPPPHRGRHPFSPAY